jgi:hypothetical protein
VVVAYVGAIMRSDGVTEKKKEYPESEKPVYRTSQETDRLPTAILLRHLQDFRKI